MSHKGNKNLLRTFLDLSFPVMLIVTNIGFFLPQVLYRGNKGEFNNAFAALALEYQPYAIGAGGLMVLVGLVLGRGVYDRYVSLLAVCGFLIWLQANVLVWEYGALDGRGLDWSSEPWRGWLDGVIWVGGVVGAITFGPRIRRAVVFSATALLCIQTVASIAAGVLHADTTKTPPLATQDSAPPWLYEFSSSHNVIQVVLDGFQADVFLEIVEESEVDYRSLFSGFTYFRGATGVYTRTEMSVPAFLSGRLYRNKVPKKRFKQEVFEGSKNIIRSLERGGYRVDFVVPLGITSRYQLKNFYVLTEPYQASHKAQATAEARKLMDLVLFRVFPHVVKGWIYRDGRWLLQSAWGKRRESLSFFANRDFLLDLSENLVVGTSEPVYKYLHVKMSHPPPVVSEDCGYAGKVLPVQRDNMKRQYECTLEVLARLLKKLRVARVYDESLILIHADHGSGFPLWDVESEGRAAGAGGIEDEFLSRLAGYALPLLAVKRPRAKGDLKISEAPVSLTDIPDTIATSVGLEEEFGGKAVFSVAEDDSRERVFFFHRWEGNKFDYFQEFYEYRILDSPFERASWRPVGSKDPAVSSYESEEFELTSNQALRLKEVKPYRLGDKITFGSGGNSQPYQEDGWCDPEPAFTWSCGAFSSLLLPLRQEVAGDLVLKVEASPFLVAGKLKEQRVAVLLNGRLVGEWRLETRGFRELSLILPREALAGHSAASVAFVLRDATSPVRVGYNKDNRILGLALRSLELQREGD